MVLRNVAKTFSLEEQRQEINEIAVDLDAVNTTLTNWNAAQWDTAYSWGDHAQAGYLVATASSYNNTNWDTAYGWGDHAQGGYLTAYQTDAQIKSSYEANADTNAFTDALLTKLNGIETGATADQTASEIKTAYESNANTNAFTDALQTKLNGIETNATADQTASEIKTAYESNADTNAFTDALQTKLNGIAAGAEVNLDPGGTFAGAGTALDPAIGSIQFKNTGNTFGGDSTFVYDNTNNYFGIGQASPESTLHVDSNKASGYVAEFNQTNASNSAQVLINSPTDDATRPVLIDLSRADNIQWSLGQAYNDSNEAFFISSGVSLSTGITGGTLGILPNGKTTIAYSDGTDSSFGALPSYGQLEIIKIGKDALSNPIDSNWSYLSFHKTGTIAWQQGVVDSSFVVGQTGGAARDDIQSERLRITEHGKFVHSGGHDNNSGGAGLSAGQYNRITASLTVPVSSTRTLTFTGLQSGFITIRGGGYANAGQGAVAFAYQLGGYMTGTSFYDVVTLQQWSNTSTISISKNSGDFQIIIGNPSVTWPLTVNFTVESSSGAIAVSAS